MRNHGTVCNVSTRRFDELSTKMRHVVWLTDERASSRREGVTMRAGIASHSSDFLNRGRGKCFQI